MHDILHWDRVDEMWGPKANLATLVRELRYLEEKHPEAFRHWKAAQLLRTVHADVLQGCD